MDRTASVSRVQLRMNSLSPLCKENQDLFRTLAIYQNQDHRYHLHNEGAVYQSVLLGYELTLVVSPHTNKMHFFGGLVSPTESSVEI